MVSHTWILGSVTLVGVADNIRRLLRYSTDNWRTEMTADGTTLGKVNVR